MAVTLTSPSPCTPWPSPPENSAAGHVDRQEQRRAGHQFLVVDVAAVPRGGIDEIMPHAGGGATPITPKNGPSGSSAPHGRRADAALAIERNVHEDSVKSSGSVPASGR